MRREIVDKQAQHTELVRAVKADGTDPSRARCNRAGADPVASRPPPRGAPAHAQPLVSLVKTDPPVAQTVVLETGRSDDDKLAVLRRLEGEAWPPADHLPPEGGHAATGEAITDAPGSARWETVPVPRSAPKAGCET